jgi:hypothetical protein
MSIIIMATSSVERVLFVQDFECFDVGRGSGDVTGVIKPVAAHRQPDSLFFFFMWFVIADYFAVSDLSVFRDVCEFDKETCVGSRNVLNALKKAPDFVAKTSSTKWL